VHPSPASQRRFITRHERANWHRERGDLSQMPGSSLSSRQLPSTERHDFTRAMPRSRISITLKCAEKKGNAQSCVKHEILGNETFAMRNRVSPDISSVQE
jgi:hypothetical protein